MTTKILNYIKTGPIGNVSLIPTFVAIIVILLWIWIKNIFLIQDQIYDYMFLFLSSILVGSTGIIYIHRREMPGPVSSVTIKGRFAVFTGFVFATFFWGLGLAGLIFAIRE